MACGNGCEADSGEEGVGQRDTECRAAADILRGDAPSNVGPVTMVRTPLTAMHYSGGGTTIMQLALTDVFGEPFPEIMRTSVLEPAGMNHSTFLQPLPPALVPVGRELDLLLHRSDADDRQVGIGCRQGPSQNRLDIAQRRIGDHQDALGEMREPLDHPPVVGRVVDPLCERKELSIDKKTQLRAPEHRMIMLACCELKNRDDVLGLQVRQVLQDLLSRRSRRKEFQNVCDTDAQAADAGSSSTHCDVCCDPIHLAQHQLLHTISTLSIITHRCGLSPRRIPRNGDRHGVGSGEDGPLPPSRSAWLGRRGLRHPAGPGRSLAVHPTGDSGPGEGNRRSTSARRSPASRSATRSTAGSTSRSAPASRGPRGPSPRWPRSCAPAAGTTSSCSLCLDARRLSAGVRGHACSHVTRPGWRTHPGIASRRTRVPARPRRRVRLRPRRASRQSAPTAAGRRPTGPVARRRPGSPGR